MMPRKNNETVLLIIFYKINGENGNDLNFSFGLFFEADKLNIALKPIPPKKLRASFLTWNR